MTKQQMQWRCSVSAGVLAAVVLAGRMPTVSLEAQQQPSEVAVVISGDPGTPPRYAVPDFVALTPDVADVAKTIGQVLWDDLNFEREFYMIPRDTYGTVPAARSVEDIPYAAWRELGADAVVFGTVQRTGGEVRVQVRLMNVRSRQSVFGKEYGGSAAGAANARLYAHTISDEIFQHQRNLRGVARTKLAFVSDRNRERLDGTVETRDVKEIYVADYDGANQRRLTVSRRLNLNPSWSPDARALVYTTFRPNPDIFVSFIYQGVLQNPTKGVGTNYLPVFSPDGKQIAFMSGRNGNPEVYVMNVDGTNVRRLTNHPAEDVTPTWSPTGTEIAFESGRTGRPQIYIMNAADGSNLRRLDTGESEAVRPTWSRGPVNEIAFAARTSGRGYDIKIFDFSSGKTRPLTFGEGTNEGPAYSPSGRHLAFTSTRSGRVQVYTIGRDGKGLQQITRDGSNQTPAWSN